MTQTNLPHRLGHAEHCAHLLNLAHAFDSQYATQICRHYDELNQPPGIKCSCDDRQLDLFEGDDVTF